MADGKYSEPDLYKAVRDGGIFCLDEFDSFVPEAIIAFNGLLAGETMRHFLAAWSKFTPASELSQLAIQMAWARPRHIQLGKNWMNQP